ncbi:MAG TPA: prolipoprotein diacylglyceryl transferase family protein, partial [Saprospiraceae bacterium]
GAILGLMIGLCAAAKILGKKESVLNLFAVSLPLGIGVHGLSCLSAGCCHGNLTSVPWGITYGPNTRAYTEQVNVGMIPSDALTSLAVHPNQIYTIITCVIIALIVWKMRFFWKSPAGSFLFAIILYLSYRVIEGLAGYSLPAKELLGMSAFLWKVILLLLFTLILIIRERTIKISSKATNANRGVVPNYTIKLLALAFINLTLSIQLADWFASYQRVIILLIVFPLCGIVMVEKIIEMLISFKHLKPGLAVMAALVLMSQTADVPPGTPKSYTSINLTSTFGKFDMEHTFNDKLYSDQICGGSYWAGDDVGYTHKYAVGGIGINRKVFYNERQSILWSLNILAGREKETPVYYPTAITPTPIFKNKLWSINPSMQYDAKHIGLGLGMSFGNVAYDKEDSDDHSDYKPEDEGRDFALQTRIRLFNEQKFFIEVLSGFDAGAVGEYNWQALGGSRFNTDKFMFKAGFAFTEHSPSSFVFKGEMLLVKNLYISPQFTFYRKDDFSAYDQERGYRAVIGLEYRFHDKVKGNSIGLN